MRGFSLAEGDPFRGRVVKTTDFQSLNLSVGFSRKAGRRFSPPT